MTDNDIIKALECCIKAPCKGCPCGNGLGIKLAGAALAIINHQKAEIERLQKRIVFWREDLNYQPEKERTEAIKEFVERLCKDRVSNDPVVIAVKVELEEMVGEHDV